MTRRDILIRSAGIALLPLLAGGTATAAEGRTHTIVMQNMKFGVVPTDLRKGDTILWVNHDIVPHTATAKNRSFDVTIQPRQSARTIVNQAGTIPFYCRYHPAMRGTLVSAR